MSDSKTKDQIENISRREERILSLLREERDRTQQKFPLLYALVATFGLVCVFSGFYTILDGIEYLNNNPIALVIIGVVILTVTGAVYKKL